jgi:hypothetical protein
VNATSGFLVTTGSRQDLGEIAQRVSLEVEAVGLFHDRHGLALRAAPPPLAEERPERRRGGGIGRQLADLRHAGQVVTRRVQEGARNGAKMPRPPLTARCRVTTGDGQNRRLATPAAQPAKRVPDQRFQD